MRNIPERDWRYLSSLKPELIEKACLKMNNKIRAILALSNLSEDEKRRRIYDLVHQNDRIIGQCFDDWRRSEIFQRCVFLSKHKLLSTEHIQNLAPETQEIVSGEWANQPKN